MNDGLVHVMAEKCASCIFGPNSPVSPERFADLREQWETRGAEMYQVCHQTATWDEDDEESWPDEDVVRAVCRGFFDEFYVRRGTPVALLQIAERLGFINLEYRVTEDEVRPHFPDRYIDNEEALRIALAELAADATRFRIYDLRNQPLTTEELHQRVYDWYAREAAEREAGREAVWQLDQFKMSEYARRQRLLEARKTRVRRYGA